MEPDDPVEPPTAALLRLPPELWSQHILPQLDVDAKRGLRASCHGARRIVESLARSATLMCRHGEAPVARVAWPLLARLTALTTLQLGGDYLAFKLAEQLPALPLPHGDASAHAAGTAVLPTVRKLVLTAYDRGPLDSNDAERLARMLPGLLEATLTGRLPGTLGASLADGCPQLTHLRVNTVGGSGRLMLLGLDSLAGRLKVLRVTLLTKRYRNELRACEKAVLPLLQAGLEELEWAEPCDWLTLEAWAAARPPALRRLEFDCFQRDRLPFPTDDDEPSGQAALAHGGLASVTELRMLDTSLDGGVWERVLRFLPHLAVLQAESIWRKLRVGPAVLTPLPSVRELRLKNRIGIEPPNLLCALRGLPGLALLEVTAGFQPRSYEEARAAVEALTAIDLQLGKYSGVAAPCSVLLRIVETDELLLGTAFTMPGLPWAPLPRLGRRVHLEGLDWRDWRRGYRQKRLGMGVAALLQLAAIAPEAEELRLFLVCFEVGDAEQLAEGLASLVRLERLMFVCCAGLSALGVHALACALSSAKAAAGARASSPAVGTVALDVLGCQGFGDDEVQGFFAQRRCEHPHVRIRVAA